MAWFVAVPAWCLIQGLLASAAETPAEYRYLRPGSDRWVPECRFLITKRNDGWRIDSETTRGKTTLRVTADYNTRDRLLAAEAKLDDTAARVTVTDGQARVERAGQPAQTFVVPAGVIVTSAPDWTDAFLLARRFDRTRAGKQELAGLWIHPSQPAQLLRLSIEKTGSDTIEHQGMKQTLSRCEIRLRGNSGYVAWVDDRGELIRLIPVSARGPAGLVRAGYEQSAGGLRPPP